ncbi:MAG: GGDEF domain-containing protein [Solirubrobacterales bacterium]|nr:GGDEF domain-containing protein [Solirubrobacterales bacterium]
MLLVIPATVPAFASGDDFGTVEGSGAADTVASPVAPEAAPTPEPEPAPAPEPAAEPAAEPAVPAPAEPKKVKKLSASPNATVIERDAAAPTADPPVDDPSGATDEAGATGETGGTGPTGSTGSTGPSGPIAGGGGVEDPSGSGDTPTNNAPTTGEGTQPSGTTIPGEAPSSNGILTEGGDQGASNNGNSGDSETAGTGAADTEQIVNTLSNGVENGKSGAADTRSVASRTTDQIQRNAESGVVASLVVTRIISEIPVWVFWALGALAVIALAGLGLFLRERHRRRSAELDAMVDELTGISNRKAFDRRLDLEWRRAARYGRSLGLMVMDLDGFKQVNDLKGHAAGDRVLRDVAQALDKRMRDTDLVARIGGDEFAVICPETGINELMTIRRQLSEQTTREIGEVVGLSIGVAEYVPSDDDATSILARADESMYRVKRGEATALPA